MKRLFIAEKPSVGKAIAGALGVKKSYGNYIECKTGDTVTWCFGHLMELEDADVYLPDGIPVTKSGKKRWRQEDLPILPETWKTCLKKKDGKTDPGIKKQYQLIVKLTKAADVIVGAGDPDREGQLLIDEVLETCKLPKSKQILRYWASAVDDASVKKALNNLQPNNSKKFVGMRNAARARGHADWLIGINASRAYTLAAQRGSGNLSGSVNIGRVETPTMNLVALRDAEIQNFRPKPYFVFKGTFIADGIRFQATLQLPEDHPGLDSEKRLTSGAEAKKINDALQGAKSGTVKDCESKNAEQTPPLGYSLADIQSAANAKYGYSAQQVLNCCQKLYETYKLTSYPRSDCQYLPTSQFGDVKQVLAALKAVNPDLAAAVAGANPALKSKIWNDAKISAHHAIIPTQNARASAMTEDEKNVYRLLVLRYLAQFYPPAKLLKSKLTVSVNGFDFVCSGTAILEPGWKKITGNDAPAKDKKGQEEDQKVPALKKGQAVTVEKIAAVKELTKAPPHYTEGSLIKAMQNIAASISDPRAKKWLKDGDGIGTSATRAMIIDKLKRTGMLELKGKNLLATPKACTVLAELNKLVKDPVMTARWEEVLQAIENGTASLAEFEAAQKKFTTAIVNEVKEKKIAIQTE
ncbi:MAG: DNA topoisomerase 3 [Succinivibrionaceae bacterium]|nr:DNA topoisomerase 3 [Succinivibrionaceae bacterium]